MRPEEKNAHRRTTGPPARRSSHGASCVDAGYLVGLPKETKATLGLLSRLLGDPQWRILTDAITSLEAGLPKADKQMLARMRQR